MTRISWDVEDRFYEIGVDRGVLFSDTDPPTPWNGLVSVETSVDENQATPVYFNGVKTVDLVYPGDHTATIKAVTYPDEFLKFSGMAQITGGLYLDEQPTQTFGLCFRSLVGNFNDGNKHAYKIHLMYNLTAIPSDISYDSLSSSDSPIEFSWDVSSVPVATPGYRPMAHLVLDSRTMNPVAMSILEDILYGTEDTESRLPTPDDIFELFRVIVTDNLDGTWTAEGPEYLISMLSRHVFELDTINARYITDVLYELSSD